MNVFMYFSCAYFERESRDAQSAEKDSEEVRQRYKICAVCSLGFCTSKYARDLEHLRA